MYDITHVLDLWRAWQQAQGLSPRTIEERAGAVRLLASAAGTPPLEISTLEIVAFVGRTGLSASTRASYHERIRAFYRWAQKVKLRADDPMGGVPVPRRPAGVPRPVGDHELPVLLAACTRRRTRTMVLLAALAGLRVHEIAKVHGGDVDLVTGSLTVTGKGGSTQVIPLHDELLAEARSYPRDDWWFPSYAAQGAREPHVSRHAVGEAIARAMRRAGIRATPHQLRHWYGSTLLEQGVDVRVVQELMRHKSLQSTQIYTRVSPRARQAAIAVLALPRSA